MLLALLFLAEVVRVPASPSHGFHWPYYLSIPEEVRRPAVILVEPNNFGRSSDDASEHDRDARAIIGARVNDPDIRQLGSPILVPAFPRPKTDWKMYTHALDRDTLLANQTALRRIDLQLVAMIDDARRRLKERKMITGRRVFMWGYSAAGSFTSRFAALHPERLRAAVVGGSTLPILPLERMGNQALRYPVGVADLKAITGHSFNRRRWRRVPMIFFRGGADTNDEVAFDDGYDPEDREVINRLLGGPPPIARYPALQRVYREARGNVEFVIEEGIKHNDVRTRKEGMHFLEKHR